MRRRSRTWAKWACTAAAITTAAVALLSRFYFTRVVRVSAEQSTTRFFLIHGGLARVGCLDLLIDHQKSEVTFQRYDAWYWGSPKDRAGAGAEWHGAAGVFWEQSPYGWQIGMSLLHVVLLTAAPAALLWYADRRHGPHACRSCGYDRSGLDADARCPECGAAIK